MQLAQARRDPAAAAAVWIAYKAQFPDDPAGAMKLGRLYAEERRVEAALREYDLAHRLAPDLPSPVSSAVMLLVEQRRFEAAEVRIDALEQRDSKGVLAWQLRGELAAARGDPEGAARAYSRLIEVAPAEPSGYLGLARVREGQQRAVEAVEVLARGERANAEAAVLPAARAQALMRAARYDEAIALYEALMARHPDDDAYANNLAYLLVEHKGDAGSLERALMLVRRFDDSRNPSYLDSLGWTYYRTGRYAEAAKVLERAAVRAPEVPLFQLHLGLALHRAGQAAEAEPHLRKAIESGAALPGVDEARVLLAQR